MKMLCVQVFGNLILFKCPTTQMDLQIQYLPTLNPNGIFYICTKMSYTLTHVAQLMEHCSVQQKVMGSFHFLVRAHT